MKINVKMLFLRYLRNNGRGSHVKQPPEKGETNIKTNKERTNGKKEKQTNVNEKINYLLNFLNL